MPREETQKIRSKRGNMITEYSVQRLKVRSFIFIACAFQSLIGRNIFTIHMMMMYVVLPYDDLVSTNCQMNVSVFLRLLRHNT